jgi:hypothetical protein
MDITSAEQVAADNTDVDISGIFNSGKSDGLLANQ